MNINKLLIIFSILLLSLLSIVSSLTTQQITALNNIATDCGFSWTLPLGCSSISNFPSSRNKIVCDSTGEIIELNLEPKNTCGLRNEFNAFPALKTLILNEMNLLNVPLTIYQHPNIQQLTYKSDKKYSFVFTTDNGSNDWSKMASLKKLQIDSCSGTMPTFPTSISEFDVNCQNSKAAIIRMPFEIFNPNLTTFSIVSNYVPVDSILTTPLLANTPNLIKFELFCNGYTVDFSIFFKPPPSLKTLQLFLLELSNSTMPSVKELEWNNLNLITLNALGLTGTIDPSLFFLPSLTILYINSNPSLGGTLPSDFGTRSKLIQVFLQKAAITGSIPSNILEGGLNMIDFSGTLLSGNVPSTFLCLPKSSFSAPGSLYSVIIDLNKFTNFRTPEDRDPCVPSITSITGIMDYAIEIKGNMLGTFAPFVSVTMTNVNSPSLLFNCQPKKSGTIVTCPNPFLFGNGQLVLTVNNDAVPAPSATIGFQYESPVITSVTPVSTNGGQVTIYGRNFWIGFSGQTTQNDYAELIDDNQVHIACTDITVVNAYQTIVCTLPAGIVGGKFVVSVSGQSNVAQQFAFKYKAPLITATTTSLIPTKLQSTITVNGKDFWNETSLVSVLVQGINCPVTGVNHTILTCTFPSTAFVLPAGVLDVTVLVNGQGYTAGGLVTMMDPLFCPNNCGANGKCDQSIGQCMCTGDLFGSDCLQTTIASTYGLGSDNASITVTPTLNDQTSLTMYLASIIEGQVETFLDDWSSNTIDEQTTKYSWEGEKGQFVSITIRENPTKSQDAVITYPANSFSYLIEYSAAPGTPIDNPQFKFVFDASPQECQNLPFTLTNPTGLSTDTRFFTLNTYNVEYFGRFPKSANVNSAGGGSSSITTNSVAVNGFSNKMVSKVNGYQVTTASFEIDLTVFQTAISREPFITGCIIDNGDGGNKQEGWKIGVGVGVGIGGAAMLASAFFILKQRLKINQTQSLLEKKLKEINGEL